MREMSTEHRPGAERYEIRLKGRLDSRWAAWFDGKLSYESDRTTLLVCLLRDQAALHGLLQKVRDLGLPLLSVTSGDPHHPSPHQPSPHHPRRTT
jgi:hypothetical protein